MKIQQTNHFVIFSWFLWRGLLFVLCRFSCGCHKSPAIKFSAQIYSSASNNLLYEKSAVGFTLPDTWRLRPVSLHYKKIRQELSFSNYAHVRKKWNNTWEYDIFETL
jgi:hypothetical protein